MKHSWLVMIAIMVCGCITDATLDVQRGTGSGTYRLGKTVPVFADAPAPTEGFSEWQGDISGMSEPKEIVTTILMNQRSKTITAVYTNIVPPTPVYTYIPGNKADAGSEVWNPNFNGMDIRLSVDDVQGFQKVGINYVKGSWYCLDGAVVPAGKITLQGAPDGGIIAACSDFVSTRTGMKYTCVGFYVGTTQATAFRLGKQTTIAKVDCHNTLRYMLATVAP